MTLMEKFAKLTPEQREKFTEVKDAAALDVFVSEHDINLTDEEKAQTLEYIETGVLPLSDDALDAAAGGGGLVWNFTNHVCKCKNFSRCECDPSCSLKGTRNCVNGVVRLDPGPCPYPNLCSKNCYLYGTGKCVGGVIQRSGAR